VKLKEGQEGLIIALAMAGIVVVIAVFIKLVF